MALLAGVGAGAYPALEEAASSRFIQTGDVIAGANWAAFTTSALLSATIGRASKLLVAISISSSAVWSDSSVNHECDSKGES
jgi:hypothetical protein